MKTSIKNKRLLISPSLMCGNLFKLNEDLQVFEKHKFDYIHLMMDYPDMAIRSLKLTEKDIITFHIESRSDPHYTIKQIRDKKGQVGIAINPDTPIENIYPFLEKIDHALVTTVHPGFSGQPFVKTSHERVRILSEYINEKFPKITIGVDGAIGLEEVMIFNHMGVDHFVLGTTALFKQNLDEQAVAEYQKTKNVLALASTFRTYEWTKPYQPLDYSFRYMQQILYS